MKKFLFVLLSFCIFACLPSKIFAFDVQNDVRFFVESHRYTQEATVIVHGQYCLVGVRTKGILLKSENQKYFAELIDGIKEIDGSLQKIYVTSTLDEVLVIKEVRKKLDDGEDVMQIYQYIRQKYPKAIDKILLQNYNIDR